MLSSFSPPSSPYSGGQGLLLNSFSIERTVQCDGCLIWGLGWQAGLVAGLRVGQAYGGVPPTWVWVVGVRPQILEHPTSICDTGVNECIIYDHPSFLLLLKQQRKRPKSSGLNRDLNPDLCDASALLYHLSYQANWELVIMGVDYMPCR